MVSMRRKISQSITTIGSALLSVAMVVLFIMFAIREKDEVIRLREVVAGAHPFYLLISLVITGLYIYCQAYVYQSSLRAMKKKLPGIYSVELFLKRYFLSAFIPTGFTVSQFAFSKELQKHDITPLESHLASVIYLFMGALAYIAVLVPTLLVLIIAGKLSRPELYGSIVVVTATVLLLWQFTALLKGKGLIFFIAKRFLPDLPAFVDEWQDRRISRLPLVQAFMYALGINVLGSLLLWSAFLALGIPVSFFVAVVGYVITILVLTFSPIFQGVGLVEVSLVYGLTQFGLSSAEALASTLLFRLFQLWIPFGLGLVLFVRKRTKKLINDLPEFTLPS